MISRRSIGIRTLSMFWRLAGVTLSFWGWLFIWQNTLIRDTAVLQRYLLYNEFLLIGVMLGTSARRAPVPGREEHEFVEANRRTARQAFLGLFAVLLIEFAVNDSQVSRSFLFSFIPWLYLVLLFSNYLLPKIVSRYSFAGDREERLALAGSLEQAVRIKPWLERKSVLGLRTVGLICDHPQMGSAPFPVLGPFENAGEVLREKSITQVILLGLAPGAEQVRRLARICENAAVRLLVLDDLNKYFNHATTVFEDDGVRFIALRDEPLESPSNRLLKRTLDVAIALPVVLLVLPVFTLLVWVVQQLQSPGPVLYRQVRTGMLGRPFSMHKFRTMHPNHNCESKQATRLDPRVYPAGRWLRKFSIDELPQFLDVLRGDMSIVGPRPHLPQHDEDFAKVMRRYSIRRFIRPGITGWAQVNGFRGEIHCEADIQRRVEADIHYLENWSFSLDCLVIFKTIKQCLVPPKSAY